MGEGDTIPENLYTICLYAPTFLHRNNPKHQGLSGTARMASVHHRVQGTSRASPCLRFLLTGDNEIVSVQIFHTC